MEITTETVVLCRYCVKPMQVAQSVTDDKGKILAQRYVCNCQGTVFHHNIHSGDKSQEKK